ncbi:thiamine diphosphokinase [Bacillus mojavensis]|uniref:Thiamine diphosphokinase n=1 Tax=Bacillus mojavensis TaxID=72360 RepID=A0AAP3FYX1_BACMO|nr:thiamine diphosphokinase [Bacillus mojavensis]MCY8509920.1 thiamine diphosphokinase [Bacillus mojavensis]MDR4227637.1 thiamine diphosphokinase [Bacillus mojavensis]MEC1626412.1 thiamine diphosphokinase [Bacillus mojavensis]MEC1749305.1 thiamine diphosphokinase [Bacillus mojavensis]MEC1755504.1 thiamine diphosphokinase [Bacillus mojavensis]
MRKINIVAGGPKDLIPDLTGYMADDTIWVGVDKGTVTLLNAGIIPDEAFGDFDSITEHERRQIEKAAPALHVYQAEKDQTDLDLALDWALDKQPDMIQIFGITGGRADHFLGNIQLLYRGVKTTSKMKLIDKQNDIQMFSPGEYSLLIDQNKRYISFIPFTEEVDELTLIGFKYPLNKCHITLGSTLCISNELIHSRGTFSFAKGILIMVRSTD